MESSFPEEIPSFFGLRQNLVECQISLVQVSLSFVMDEIWRCHRAWRVMQKIPHSRAQWELRELKSWSKWTDSQNSQKSQNHGDVSWGQLATELHGVQQTWRLSKQVNACQSQISEAGARRMPKDRISCTVGLPQSKYFASETKNMSECVSWRSSDDEPHKLLKFPLHLQTGKCYL